MRQDRNPPPEKKASRRDREAEALRLNLARRKAQQRSRTAIPDAGLDETPGQRKSPAKADKAAG